MNLEFDQYFTPPSVAERVFNLSGVMGGSLVCADPTCGTGNLLDAAAKVFGSTKCIGIDKDREVISNLKKKRPHWLLASGDIFDRRLHHAKVRKLAPDPVDLLVLNPPFSQAPNKSIEIEYHGQALRGSAAMACLLRSLEIFRPQQGAIVIAPESMLFSSTDEFGRQLILQNFSISEIMALSNSTFQGARANSFAIRIAPGPEAHTKEEINKNIERQDIQLIRGGLQVHSLHVDFTGVPFVHSTAIRQLISEKNLLQTLPKTSWSGSGRIRGWCLLLPRVGIPNPSFIRAVYLNREVQLSDCVIAIICHDRMMASIVESRIVSAGKSLRELYRGTGARYVTLLRLREWLSGLGIHAD